MAVDEAAELIRASRRPLVIAGRAVRPEAELLRAFLERSGALCLDTRESKGAVPDDAPGFVPAVRGRAIAEADLVITLARNLDFEVAYGSAAIFRPGVRFLRVGRTFDDLARNRRGDVELCADMSAALAALVEADAAPSDPDRAWRDRLLAENAAKAEGLDERLAREADGTDGGMHPYSLLRRLNRYIGPDTVVVADGGDVLAFARVALRAPTYLDLGPFGCLGVGVPFANAAALSRPDARVIAVIGDGAFGFNAIEVETAVREGAEVLLVVVNNAAWNIERQDQIDHYDGRVIGTELTRSSYAALAESLGAHGETVEEIEALEPALDRALANLPAVVDVTVTRDAISPDSRSGLATVPALQATQPWDDAERRWRRVTDAKGDPMSVRPHEVEGRERPRGYSDVTSGGGVVAVAGQLPAEEVLEAGGGLQEQFGSAMARFVEALEAAGAGSEDILSVRIYVTSIDDYRSNLRELGPVFRETFDGLYPAMTLLEVTRLVDDRAVVEVEGMAVKP